MMIHKINEVENTFDYLPYYTSEYNMSEINL